MIVDLPDEVTQVPPPSAVGPFEPARPSRSRRHIEDRDGKTYRESRTRALTSAAPIVQLVTWNDWGEGTMIEPSVEFGYRDLEATQQLSRQYVRSSPYSSEDLRLPIKLYALRKQHKGDNSAQAKLDEAARLLFAGRTKEARERLFP